MQTLASPADLQASKRNHTRLSVMSTSENRSAHLRLSYNSIHTPKIDTYPHLRLMGTPKTDQSIPEDHWQGVVLLQGSTNAEHT
eukprot:scaffold3283_cov22-Tisochrysis_lutea.AAC.2